MQSEATWPKVPPAFTSHSSWLKHSPSGLRDLCWLAQEPATNFPAQNMLAHTFFYAQDRPSVIQGSHPDLAGVHISFPITLSWDEKTLSGRTEVQLLFLSGHNSTNCQSRQSSCLLHKCYIMVGKYCPRMKPPASLREDPSLCISHRVQSSRPYTKRGRSGIRPLLQLAVDLAASCSLTFLMWEGVLWGRSHNTVKFLEHNACLLDHWDC